MTTKVAKKVVESNFPPLEKYLNEYDNIEVAVFSKLFQKHTPLELHQTLNDFQSNIPFSKGGELIGSLRFIIYALCNDFLMIHGIVSNVNIPIKITRSLDDLINELSNYTDALEIVKYFDVLTKMMLIEVSEYTQKECDILFDLKNAYFEIWALSNGCDVSNYLNN